MPTVGREAPEQQPLILNVDDNDDAREFKSVVLSQAAFRVVEASCGHDALAIVERQPPDLVLLDLSLPDIDGVTVCARLRTAAALDWMPILLVTAAYRNDAAWARGLSAGADAYVRVPFDASVLVEMIRGRADGTFATVRLASRYLPDRDEFQTFVADVSPQKRLEESPTRRKMEAIGRLAGGVAHDFNNIVTAIAGYSDMVLEQLTPDKTLFADLQEIKKAGERAASLTVYGIIKQLNGFIWVESVFGSGTTFTVMLPVAVEPAQTGERPRHEPGAVVG